MNIKTLEKIIESAVKTAKSDRIVDAGDVLIDVRFENGVAYHHDTIFPNAPHHDLCFCGDCPAAKVSRTRKVGASWMRIGRRYIVGGIAQLLIAVRHERHAIVLTFSASQEKVNKDTKFTEVIS